MVLSVSTGVWGFFVCFYSFLSQLLEHANQPLGAILVSKVNLHIQDIEVPFYALEEMTLNTEDYLYKNILTEWA